jgi:hypothetical protein
MLTHQARIPTIFDTRAASTSDSSIFTRELAEPRVYLFLPPKPTWQGFQAFRESAINTPITSNERDYPLGCFGLDHLNEWKQYEKYLFQLR